MEINRNSARRARQRKATEMETLRQEVRSRQTPTCTDIAISAHSKAGPTPCPMFAWLTPSQCVESS